MSLVFSKRDLQQLLSFVTLDLIQHAPESVSCKGYCLSKGYTLLQFPANRLRMGT